MRLIALRSSGAFRLQCGFKAYKFHDTLPKHGGSYFSLDIYQGDDDAYVGVECGPSLHATLHALLDRYGK